MCIAQRRADSQQLLAAEGIQGGESIFICSLGGRVAPVTTVAAEVRAVIAIVLLPAMPLEPTEVAERFVARVGVVGLGWPCAHSSALPAEE